jgi:hypothetical protein
VTTIGLSTALFLIGNTMALTKYNAQPPPQAPSRTWLYAELRKIETANAGIIDLLEALGDKPIEIGAPNSGGAGFRALIVPN